MSVPFNIQTKEFFNYIESSTPIPLTVSSLNTLSSPTSLGSLKIYTTSPSNQLLITGYLPFSIPSQTFTGSNGSISVTLSVFKNTNTQTPVYTESKVIASATSTTATPATTCPFYFVFFDNTSNETFFTEEPITYNFFIQITSTIAIASSNQVTLGYTNLSSSKISSYYNIYAREASV